MLMDRLILGWVSWILQFALLYYIMEMHEKASRKHYTKYAESSNTSNKLYAEAVVNRSRICPKLNKAQSEVRTFMYYCTVRINMCNGCMIVLSSTIFFINAHSSNGWSLLFSFLVPANMEKVLCDKNGFRAAP
jgi:hypothetical protein